MKQSLLRKLLTLSELKKQQIIKWLTGEPPSVLYIGGSEALPSPLSPEEEAQLLCRLSPEASEIKKTLIERNLRLVVYVAR